jgi:hypothetical protein
LVVTDAGRMAVLAALRRDWAAPPTTLDYTPAITEVLFTVAAEIESEQLARTTPLPEDLPL